MIDLVTSKCLETSCMKRPNYGNPGDKRPKFCKDHSS